MQVIRPLDKAAEETLRKADKVMRDARRFLLLHQPFFGSLALKLQLEPAVVPMAANDGTTLFYNPEWAIQTPRAELEGVWAHEVMHCAGLHMYRMTNREHMRWNVACDLAINPILIKAGLKLPANTLNDPRWQAGESAEEIYPFLPSQQQQQQNGQQAGSQGQGTPQNGKGVQGSGNSGKGSQGGSQTPQQGNSGKGSGGSSWCEMHAPPTGGSDGTDGDGQDGQDNAQGGSTGQYPRMSAEEWQIAAEQAAKVARGRGVIPAEFDRLIKSTREYVADWKSILRQFIDHTVPRDFSWATPNRRYIAHGMYLPGIVKENAPKFCVAVDTSGSVSQAMLNQFAAEISAILAETHPIMVDVIYCDAKIAGREQFTPDDPEVVLNAKGGGGTAFQPVFDLINGEDDRPAALIYLTDLMGDNPREPEYPVLWVVPELVRGATAPFGQLVKLPMAE